ncbi:MAG: efflux RND transporter periplasmic adaptor subunit [Firmicutes bacterium]|nr:efflux RND transporter periplasmic adaptor subunit [Bacillota bacterium]
MKRTLIPAIIVAVIAVGLIVWRLAGGSSREETSPRQANEARPVRVVAAEQGNIEQFLEITGTLEAERKADIASKLSGKVERVLVDEGDPVAAGQILAVLDQRDYHAQVAQAEAAVQAAQANRGAAQARLAALRAGARPQELRQAEEAVQQAKASLDNATANYNRTKDLFSQGAISQQQMDAAQLQLDVTKAQYKSAVQRLDLTKEGPRREDIQAAEEQARQAEAAVGQARAALQLTRVNLDNTVVRSSISGVVAKRYVQPGEAFTMASSTVVTVVDNSRVYVRGEVSETNIRRARRGQPVVVRVDALPGREFAGQVTEILPAADARSRMFSVKIRIPNPQGELKEGMFARARIAVEQRQVVTLIPRRAVLDRGGNQVAFVVNSDVAHERKLELGAAQGDFVEVRQGVRPGERVIVEGQHDLSDGAHVAVNTEEAR